MIDNKTLLKEILITKYLAIELLGGDYERDYSKIKMTINSIIKKVDSEIKELEKEIIKYEPTRMY